MLQEVFGDLSCSVAPIRFAGSVKRGVKRG